MTKPIIASVPSGVAAAAGSAPTSPRRRSAGRIIGATLFGILAGIVVIALIAAGFVVFTIQRSFPQLSGTVAVPGLGDDVIVQRDALGIPTITASTTDDLFFAEGFVHAQDRFWEMDFRRHVTSGRLSELFGVTQLGTDRFLRTLGWRQLAEQEVAELDEATRSYYDAYAEGVNAYLADHDGADASFEYAVLGLQNTDYEIEAWTAADSVAWLKAMAWDLRTNIEDETDRALMATSFSAEQIDALYPGFPFDTNPVIVPKILPPTDPETAAGASATGPVEDGLIAAASVEWMSADSVLEAVDELVGGAGEGVGSNSWVVGGDLTETGMPLLANDPHLGAALPSVWHQVGLKCRAMSTECPFDVSGFSFSGVPGVIIGHNDRIAWGFTNLTTDVTDLYVERVYGDRYLRDGVLVPLEERTETIGVAGGDDVELLIRSTTHGPIVSGLTDAFTAIADEPFVAGAGGTIVAADDIAVPEAPAGGAGEPEWAVALQWTALQPGTTASAIFALNLASDFEEFRRAAALFDVPAQNLIYAGVEGDIGYQAPGRLPIRGAGDGWMPQPGWDSAYDWSGYIPFEELPVAYNPDEGYIVTANNAITGADYPYQLTSDWDYGWRAARIVDLLERKAASAPLTADDLRDIQADNEFHIGKRLAHAYLDIETGKAGPDAALDLLRSWDAQNAADSAAAAYGNVLWDQLITDLFVAGRAQPAPVGDHGRMFLVVDRLLQDRDAPWWTNDGIGAFGRDQMLAHAAERAYDRLVELQGDDPSRWNWGSLHALTLSSDTFGSSGIPPIEMLFNRGPYEVGGGGSVVNATGWSIGSGFATATVPSMRMVVDLSDFDASGWNHLTGTSGHAYHPNYVDQTQAWQRVELTPWAFTPAAVDAATADTLILTPAD